MEMTLRLPNNYVEIEEEEMMYLDGGWSSSIARSNLKGIKSWLQKHAPSRVLAQTGAISEINNIVKYYAGASYARVASLIGSALAKVSAVISAVGNWVWVLVIGVATAAGTYALGMKRFF